MAPQVYIRNCGSHRIEIGHQMFVMKRLEAVAQAVVLGDSKDERKRILKERLSEIVLPTTFKLPLSPHLNVRLKAAFVGCRSGGFCLVAILLAQSLLASCWDPVLVLV